MTTTRTFAEGLAAEARATRIAAYHGKRTVESAKVEGRLAAIRDAAALLAGDMSETEFAEIVTDATAAMASNAEAAFHSDDPCSVVFAAAYMRNLQSLLGPEAGLND